VPLNLSMPLVLLLLSPQNKIPAYVPVVGAARFTVPLAFMSTVAPLIRKNVTPLPELVMFACALIWNTSPFGVPLGFKPPSMMYVPPVKFFAPFNEPAHHLPAAIFWKAMPEGRFWHAPDMLGSGSDSNGSGTGSW